ncbi:hypothetical protein [Candidatus Electronema sp. JC]|uniref:hypothetical protein n=1 Tax=Candidatus Electronema sp. JC TaxID=3401570 RepID=UPI003B428F64
MGWILNPLAARLTFRQGISNFVWVSQKTDAAQGTYNAAAEIFLSHLKDGCHA